MSNPSLAKNLLAMTRDTLTSGQRRMLIALLIGSLIFVAVAFFIYQRGLASNAREAMGFGQYSRAFEFYLVDAENGDGNAQNSVGNLYYLGLGIERDFDAANLWYRKAASGGHAAAQLNLGHMYKQGLGVVQDPVRAFGWYHMSNIYGNPTAEYHLTQISREYTLSPLMIESAIERWTKLSEILNEDP